MSDIKRAQLIPLGTQKESEKSVKEPRKTVRITVVLPESTEDTCPEYNYKDELAAAKKRTKLKEGGVAANGLLKPIEDLEGDDDDVRRIARQMEEKYGTGTSLNKKKRKGRKDDYADIGMGYDESDSFIDNTDGYDEMIPQNVTTLHGGFYINSGALEFKTDDEANSDFSSSSSDDEENPDKIKIGRKRVIESSDETDRENKTESVDNHLEKKRKMQNGGNGLQQSLKKKLLGQQNKIYIKKRRLLDPQKKTVKELLREKREDLNMSIPQELAEDEDPSKDPKKTMSITSVTDVIESVVRASAKDTPQRVEDSENKAPAKVFVNSFTDGESSHEATKPDVKLPENLPADIVSVIAAIKNASDRNTDSKNMFSSEVNLLILRLERKCKCLGKPSKMKVYEHLAVFLKCKVDVLLSRAKNLVLEDERKKLKTLIASLQGEINKVMPGLLESHEKESQRILQKKFSQESVENEEMKSLRMPKRRFQWNDATKKFLKDILMMKKRCLLLEGKSKELLDSQMAAFLKSDVQVLWPEGWMSMNALNKIYTTYADPKRISTVATTSASLVPQNKPSVSSSNSMKNLPLNTPALSITPIVKSDVSEVTVTKTETINLPMKTLPEASQPCDIKPVSPKRELEGKIKVKSQNELLKSPVSNHKKDGVSLFSDDSVIILDSVPKQDRFSPVKEKNLLKSDDSYCQVIDLSDKNDFKIKPESSSNKSHQQLKETIITPQIPAVSKHLDLSITPAYPKVEHLKTKTSCAGDDIQKVMEDLKVLQKMSSPKKSVDPSVNSSAVSVIAVNKSFAPKSVPSTMQRFDYNKTTDYNSSFQDEFQKQLYSAALNHISPNSNKNYNSIDRYPHIAGSSTGMVTGDKYYQNSNNNYAQTSNGHKSNTSVSQSGTYGIFDDMFANLLSQYGYSKEAAAPKSQQK